jgi:hypothetical protein
MLRLGTLLLFTAALGGCATTTLALEQVAVADVASGRIERERTIVVRGDPTG